MKKKRLSIWKYKKNSRPLQAQFKGYNEFLQMNKA